MIGIAFVLSRQDRHAVLTVLISFVYFVSFVVPPLDPGAGSPARGGDGGELGVVLEGVVGLGGGGHAGERPLVVHRHHLHEPLHRRVPVRPGSPPRRPSRCGGGGLSTRPRRSASSSGGLDAVQFHHLQVAVRQQLRRAGRGRRQRRPTCPPRSCGPWGRGSRPGPPSCTRRRGRRRPRPPPAPRSSARRTARRRCRGRTARRRSPRTRATFPTIMFSSATKPASAGGADHDPAARQPLADVVVRVAARPRSSRRARATPPGSGRPSR